jgi:Sec-independent protein translocase protein TatA
MVLGLGVPELIIIIVAAALFFFGAPKVKEWIDTFKKTKNEAKEIVEK